MPGNIPGITMGATTKVRPMRLAILLLLPLPAVAQVYQIDLTGTDANSGNPFVAQWDMDLGASQFSINSGSPTCFQNWSASGPVTNFTMTLGGNLIGSMSAPTMGMGGSAAVTCGGLFFDGITLRQDGKGFLVDFTTVGQPGASVLGALVQWEKSVPDGAGGFGVISGDYHLSIQPVSAPEPGTLALFSLGLVGLALVRRRV